MKNIFPEWIANVATALAVLVPLVSAVNCPPGHYPDPVFPTKCFNCSQICHPKHDTPEQCARTPQCMDILREGLKRYYDNGKETPPSPPPEGSATPCPAEDPLLDKPLVIGLAVGIGALAIIITAVAVYRFAVWRTGRALKENLDCERTKGPIAHPTPSDSSTSLLSPTGSTPSSSNNSSVSNSQASLPQQDPDQTHLLGTATAI